VLKKICKDTTVRKACLGAEVGSMKHEAKLTDYQKFNHSNIDRTFSFAFCIVQGEQSLSGGRIQTAIMS
jgi:hypothetical protein